MGCAPSSENKQASDQIDAQIRKDQQAKRSEVKMLLLGAGESGKSTILKQMQLIHGMGYTQHERQAFKEIVFSNLVQSMKVLVDAAHALNIPLADPQRNQRHVQLLVNLPNQLETDVLPREVAVAIHSLWNDRGIQQTFARSREFQLNDSAKYYCDAIERIAEPAYMPTDQDILRSRVKTTGIVETTFKIGDLTYKMFDVGGQRSERKKWIHCFENVTAIVFLVAISEYDQVLIEDESMNRMHESLTLFDSICNSRWFTRTSIILFLNKIDLFKQKLGTSPLSRYFPDYQAADTDYDAACEFFLHKFTDLNRSQDEKQVYTHFTCATDTTQIRFVMAAVNDIVIKENLRRVGLL
ncbi:guanine nucleotide-binding protein subunit alpha [Sorochytrium milnesiophthora]